MMNNYDPFVCNWKVEEFKAKSVDIATLLFWIEDCKECISKNINPNKYFDQISVYRAEIDRKEKVLAKKYKK